jgi:putative ABC transport system permease protein
LAEGVVFHPRKFEAVIGSEVVQRTGLKIGSRFKATHGMAAAGQTPDVHDEQWSVVGILKQTHTANDRAIFVSLLSSFAVPEHEAALLDIARITGTAVPVPSTQPAGAADADHDEHAYSLNPDGTIDLHLPKQEWRISAILVSTRGVLGQGLMWVINQGDVAMAVNPASEMRQFFDTFLGGAAMILLLVSLLVTIVAAVSILVSIYNSISARKREIAILRALGATRARILTLICVEAGLVGLAGGVGGLVVGHLLGAAGSLFLQWLLGEGIDWLAFGSSEWLYLLAVVVLSVLAGLVPALKAYRTPVAANLVAA